MQNRDQPAYPISGESYPFDTGLSKKELAVIKLTAAMLISPLKQSETVDYAIKMADEIFDKLEAQNDELDKV